MERHVNYRLILILFALFFTIVASASPQGTTYQARIVKPDGLPLETANVNFKFTVLDPAAACILYAETFSAINMSNSAGVISFTLGSGLKTYPASATTFAQVFNNSTPALSCDAGGPPTYSPQSVDVRKVVMQFNDGAGWQTLPAMSINAVPYSIYSGDSLRLGGVSATSYVQYSTIPTCTASQAIRYDGSSFSCVTLSSGAGAITSGDVTTALGYTPADLSTVSTSFTTVTNSLSTVGTSFSTVTSTLTSLGSSVTAVSTSLGSLATSFTTLTAAVNSLGTSYTALAASVSSITSSQWVASGSAISYSAGKVGIGTSAPDRLFHVKGLSYSMSVFEDDTEPYVVFRKSNAGVGSKNFGLSYDGNKLYFSRMTDAYSWSSTLLTLTASGNLGVGTPNPSSLLHVSTANDSTYGGALVENSNANQYGALSVRNDAGRSLQVGVYGSTHASGNGNRAFIYAGSTTSALDFYSGTVGRAMSIDGSSGNVGVGTTTPVTKLDVSGGVRIGIESSSCVMALTGTLRYSSGNVEYCNGTTWQAFGTAGAVTSSSIIAALTYTPANSTSVTTSLISTNSNITSVSSTVSALAGTVSSVSATVNTLAGTVSSVSSSVTSLAASMAAIRSSQWTTTGANISYDSGKVGIGTSNPAVRLEISNGLTPLFQNFDAIAISGFNGDWSEPVSATIGLSKGNYNNTYGEALEFRHTSGDTGLLPPQYVFRGIASATDIFFTDGTINAHQILSDEYFHVQRKNTNAAAFFTILPGTSYTNYDFWQVHAYVGSSFSVGAVSAAGAVTGYNIGVGSGTFAIKTSNIDRLTVNNSGAVEIPGNVILGSIPNYVNGGSGLYISNDGSSDPKNFFRIDAYNDDLAIVGSSLAGASQGTTLSFNTTLAGGGINAATRMRIAANGQVGIGTTNPTALLHLAAGTTASASLKLTSGTLVSSPQAGAIEYDGANLFYTDGTSTRRTIAATAVAGSYDNVSVVANASGNIALYPNGGAGVVTVSATTASTNSQTGALVVKGGLGVAGNINSSGTILTSSNIQGSSITATSGMITPVIYGSTAASGSLILNSTTHATKGNIYISPQDSGSVAIGAVEPLLGLHVQKPGPLNLVAIFQAGASSGSVALGTNATYPTSGGQVQALEGFGGAGTLALNPIGGNVGIGVASPKQALDVLGFIQTSGISGAEGSNLGALSFYNRNSTGFEVARIQAYQGDSDLNSGSISFQTGDSGIFNEKMRILHSGNVGIGTASPTTKLDVSGAIRVSYDSSTCSSLIKGAMRFNPTENIFELCDGSSWSSVANSDLIPASSTVIMKTCAAGWTNTGAVDAGPGTANCNGSTCQKCHTANAALVPANSSMLMESCPTGWTYQGATVLAGPPAAAFMIAGQSVAAFATCQSPATNSVMPKGSRLLMATCPASWTTLGDTAPGPTLVGCSGVSCKMCEVPGGINNIRVLFGGNAASATLTGSDVFVLGGNGGTTSGNGGAVYIQAGVASSTSTYSDVYLQASGGRVGVGTLVPAFSFDAASSTLIRGGVSHTVAAPSYAGTYFSFDGNSNTAGLWAINPSSSQFAFYTKVDGTDAGTERMRINYNGYVGIGTSAPTTRLDIAGGGGSVMRVLASANAGATPSVDEDFLLRLMPQNATTEGGHLELKGAANYSDWTMDTTSGELRFFEPNQSRSTVKTRSGILFMVNSSVTSVPTSIDALKIASNGNVGIGQVTPTTPLHVASTATNTSAIATLETTGAGGRPYLKFRAESTDMGYVGYGSTGQSNLILMNYVSGPTYLGTNSAIRMSITSSGSVGIGTQTPTQKLDVVGTSISDYVTIRASDGVQEGGELQLLGAAAYGNIQLDNFQGNFRVHTLASGKIMQVLGGTLHVEGTGGKNYFASNVGIGNSNPLAELDITGNGRATGTFATWSDRRAKKNIKVIPDSLNKILQLRGVGFDWRTDEFPEKKFKATPDIGVIAQEVEKVFPEVVNTASDGYKSVGYAQLVAPLIEAVKELYYKITGIERKVDRTIAEVDALKAENAELKARLERLEKMMLNQPKSK